MGKRFFNKNDYSYGGGVYIDTRDYYERSMDDGFKSLQPEFCNAHPELASNKAQRALVKQWKRYGNKAVR